MLAASGRALFRFQLRHIEQVAEHIQPMAACELCEVGDGGGDVIGGFSGPAIAGWFDCPPTISPM